MEATRGRSLPSAPGAVLGVTLATVLAAFVAWPVLALLAPALDARGDGLVTRGDGLVTALLTTAGVALGSTLVAVVLASVLAWLAARRPGLASRTLVAAMVAPLVFPPFAAALGLRLGLDALGAAPRSIAGAVAAVALAQIVTLVPHAIAIMRNAMRRIDLDLEDAAVSLGAPPGLACSRVTVALLRPGVRCAALVVLALALADVASPLAIGGAARFLGVHAVAATERGDVARASAAALALSLPCLVAWVAGLSAGWMRFGALTFPSGTASSAARGSSLGSVVMFAGAVLLLGAYAVVPVAALRTDADVPMLLGAIGASITLAATVAIVGTVLAFAASVVAVRLPVRAARWLGWTVLATAGVPGIALALGWLVAWDSARASVPLWVPVLALATWKLPSAVALLCRRLRAHDPALEEVAVSLGAGNVTVTRRIVAPLLAPAVAAAFLDLFVQALTSVSVLLLLAPERSASASALTRGAAGDVAGSATLVTGIAVVTVLVVLVRGWLAPREPLALLPA